MQHGANETPTIKTRQQARAGKRGFSVALWAAPAGLACGLTASAVAVRLAAGPRFEGLSLFAASAAVAVTSLAFWRLRPKSPSTGAIPAPSPGVPSDSLLQELLNSAAPIMLSVGLDGRIAYGNPAAEHLLGYSASELLALPSAASVLASGEEARLRVEMAKLPPLPSPALLPDNQFVATYMNHLRTLPASQLPSFDAEMRRKNGTTFPVTLQISAWHDGNGTFSGLVAVAFDRSAALRQERTVRDVTHQKQREHRLALQLVVSQIVGENTSAEAAAGRVLEALCVSQGWDLALSWELNAAGDQLQFGSAWGVPEERTQALIEESRRAAVASGVDLPGQVWQNGQPVWVADLAAAPSGPRTRMAVGQGMVSGWAVPVRLGNKLLAVLEFYCRFRLREDRETIAMIETVAASLAQMLAQTRERGRAEELYRQQQIVLDSVADGICGVDRTGAVSFANPAAARLLGADVKNMRGQTVHELLHGSAPVGLGCGPGCQLLRATTARTAAAGEDTIFRADGSNFPAEYFLTPILDEGRFSGSVLSFHDISQRYALDNLKDEFISTVSHELRTPLTSIRGALGLLSSGLLGQMNDKAANLLRIALSNSDRLVRLINDILDLERIQSGREPLTFRKVQLAEVVGQAIDGMQPVADAAGVHLVHDTTQVEIAADPDRLLQVMTNLLSNAVKFSPLNATVSVVLRPGANGVMLSVIDSGRGIPADKLEAIFGRFQQVDASDSRQKGGSGLGLAICRTIVLQHSGRIWAERNPLQGSTFRVFLPYRPGPAATVQNRFESEPGQGTVLLADANGTTRALIAAQLSRHGYKVIEAATVEQTLAAAREGVEAILLDTSLDGMNGWEILPMLRRLDPGAQTPIVLLSVENQQHATGLPADAEGWVTKPLEEEALLNELSRVLCGPGEETRILVVEDDADLARVIGDVFSRDGIAVELAHSLQAALDKCYSFEPHLLVLDIGLPDGDGFNVVDWLRKHENLARLPLVVYSARELLPTERRQLTLGPTHFLTKARVQPQQLEALVLTMLRSSRQVEEVPAPASVDGNL